MSEDVVKTTFNIPKGLLKRMKQYALDTDKTVTEVVLEAFQEYLKKKSK